MGILEHLEPQKVFYFFEEICQIPHGSGNVEAISDYLKHFAVERGLNVIQDELKNIIIIKEATPGYEEEETVILQGHMDMVAVSKPQLSIDMTKEPLKLMVDGDNLYAEGTSLGGDDGIAVAYALAILDDDSLKHPRLEVVITVDEETGMDGARGIDLSMLQGKRLLNLDSEEEGIFWTSCAGGVRVKCKKELTCETMKGLHYEITLGGLQGGHSGAEIHKERGNANNLAGRLLWKLVSAKLDVGLIKCVGGVADNAICRETKIELIVNAKEAGEVESLLMTLEQEIQIELKGKDNDFAITYVKGDEITASCVSNTCKDTGIIAAFLMSVPSGVQAMSAHIPELVETSLNLGVLRIDAQNYEFCADFSVRSSIESSKWALVEQLKSIAWLSDIEVQSTGDYPGWPYRVDSPLRDKMIAIYERMYGEKPGVKAIHAGLECGLLADKIKDLDCVSFGPNMANIHTTEETLSISSVKRVWDYLIALLEEKDK